MLFRSFVDDLDGIDYFCTDNHYFNRIIVTIHMKTEFLSRCLRSLLAFSVCSLVFACGEEIDTQDPNFNPESGELTPNEVEKQLNFISDNLLDITLDYTPEKEKNLDKVIEKIKQCGIVKEVRRFDSYIEVIDQDDFSICYPFVLPPLFESDDASASLMSSMSPFPEGLGFNTPETRAVSNGGAVVFNFFTEDETRKNQNLMIKSAAYNLHNLSGLGSLENIYRGKSEFTGDNLNREIHNSSNRVIIVSSHGFDNCIVTGESVTADSYSGWSKREKQEAMAQNRVVDVGDKDKNGNRLYNKIWRVTDGLEHMGEKLIYFTGCNVMSTGVREALKNVNGLVVGWDGKNSLGEAVGLIMADCLSRMSFKEFYRMNNITIDDVTPGLSSAHLVYTGKSTDFSIKKFNSQSFKSRIIRPKEDFNKVKFMMGSRYIDVGYNIDESDFGNKDGYICLMVEHNPTANTTWVTDSNSEALFPYWWHEWTDLLADLFRTNQCRSYYLKEPGVYKIHLCLSDTNQKIQDFLDVKYVLYSSKFQTNYVEAIEKPAPKVGTVVTMTDNGMVLYGAQTNAFDDNYEYGFSVFERGNESSAISIKASLLENSTQVFSAAVPNLPNTVYWGRAFVKDADGNLYWGNTVEFTVTNSTITEPTPGDLIDLGLSVKWASCNLGAAEPQDPGDYYAWGETQTKSSYNWSTYLLSNGSSSSMKKYCTQSSYGTVDNKTTLELTDDAAYVNTNGKMRMPTAEECQELREKCQWAETQYKGRDGFLVYSPTTGNAIFIPNNGLKCSYLLNTDSPYYWTADLNAEESFRADAFLVPRVAKWDRSEGLGIRPVSNSQEVDTPETETITVNGISFKMVKVDAGSFMMGSPDDDPDAGGIYSDEKPQHRVALSSYAIGETEVTQALWKAVMGNNPSVFMGDDLPVEEVSWEDAQSFVKKLSSLTGRSFRLPTEAEWEYAARGGKYSKGYKYSGSDDVFEVSWNCENSDWTTHAVATKKPNELGLYDMSGNVWEWCGDWYDFSYYSYSPSENPCNTVASSYHIHRGASFEYILKDNRVAMRGDYVNPPSNRMRGLRLVLSDLLFEVDPYQDDPYQVVIPEAVDLGLSVKWASLNLGASKPEEYGDYFAWGETEPYYSSQDPFIWKDGKSGGYSWSSYKWCMGSEKTMTKYCDNSLYGYHGFTDEKTVLDLEDDAAHANLGGKWRMPTDTEWAEIRDNCTWTWTTQNGVNGYKVTGPSGGSIFLPAVGYRVNSYLYDVGSYAGYWYSSLVTVYPYSACVALFDSDGVYIGGNGTRRYVGNSIRPVYDDSN